MESIIKKTIREGSGSPITTNTMRTAKQRIRLHETAIEILEVIQWAEISMKTQKEFLDPDGFIGSFPKLRAKSLNRIDTLERAIVRLNERHAKVINQLQNS